MGQQLNVSSSAKRGGREVRAAGIAVKKSTGQGFEDDVYFLVLRIGAAKLWKGR